jgi:hypothetical protein
MVTMSMPDRRRWRRPVSCVTSKNVRLPARDSTTSSADRSEEYPHITFASRSRKTVRCIPDKLPMGIEIVTSPALRGIPV